MGRWLIMRGVAWALRRNVPLSEIDDLLRKRLPWHDWAWRAAVYNDAEARNQRRLDRAA